MCANAKPVVRRTWYSGSSLGLKECEGPIGRDWDSVDEGERSRFEMTGDCCETILLEGRHTMSDDEFYAADAHTQEYRVNFSEEFSH